MMDKYKKIGISGRANGEPLPTVEYVNAGDQLYVCRLQNRLRTEETILLEFELDKALEPSPSDWRELGVMVAFREFYGPVKRGLEPFLLI